MLTREAREAFVGSEGRWSVTVVDLGLRRLEALRTLRGFLQGTPVEVGRLLSERKPILEGALVEVERVEILLDAVGAAVSKSRIPDE
jgi:hypothetical protein